MQRLEHGICPLGFDEGANETPPETIVSFDSLDWSDDLKSLITGASRNFGIKSELGLRVQDNDDGGDETITPLLREKITCIMDLNDGGCTVASDLLRIAGLVVGNEDIIPNRIQGVFKISFQLEPRGVPMELLRLGVGYDSDISDEADESTFGRLTEAVGLPSTPLNAGQLTAAIILASQPKEIFLDALLASACPCSNSECRYPGIPNGKTPIFRIVAEVMKNGFTEDPLIYVQEAGVEAANGFYRKRHSGPDTFYKNGSHGGEPVVFTMYRFHVPVDGWAIKIQPDQCIYYCNTFDTVPPKHGWQSISPLGNGPAPIVSYIT